MKRKMGKPAREERPQPAQIEAIRRLAEEGRDDEAHARLDRLRHQFPGFRPLLALAYEVAALGGSQLLTIEAAWNWTRGSPNSAAAWEALHDAAGGAFPALAIHASRRLDALADKPLKEIEDVSTPFGPLSFEASWRMDLCRVMLSCSRFDEAAALVEGIAFPSARNNLALAEFARGRIASAAAMIEANWRETPANLFALERLIRLRLWTEGTEAAAAFTGPLLATRPQRWDDLRAKMIALLLLERFAEAEALYTEFADWEHEDERCELHYLGAYAAWRLGDVAGMEQRLKESGRDGEGFEEAGKILDRSLFLRLRDDAPDWVIGDRASWWPMGNIAEIRKTTKTDEDAARTMDRLAPSNAYLGRMMEQGGEGGRVLGFALLKYRAGQGDAAAIAELRGLLARPCGPDQQRSEIHGWLAEKGFLAKGERSQLLAGGALREVRAHHVRIVATPMGEDELPPADAKDYHRMHDLMHAGKHEAAHEVMARLHQKHPDNPRILANFAAIRQALGHPPDEVEALVRRAFEIDPDYLFARTNLANILAGRGDTEGAVELVKPLMERDEMHISEWRALTLTQMEIARAKGDFADVMRLGDMLDTTKERFA